MCDDDDGKYQPDRQKNAIGFFTFIQTLLMLARRIQNESRPYVIYSGDMGFVPAGLT